MQHYDLKHPIAYKLGGEEGAVERVSIRRLTGADMRIIDDFDGKPVALTLALIDRIAICDIPITLSDKLDIEDVNALGESLGEMLSGFQPTGSIG